MNDLKDFDIYEDEDGAKILTAYLGHDKKVSIPEGVVAIEDESDAFIGNLDVEEIVFPEGFEYIPSFAISGCKNLKKVVLPSTICEINNGAFNDCENLEEINFPEGLSIIATQAFDSCPKLTAKNVNLPSSLQEISLDSFADTISILKKNPSFVEIDGMMFNKETKYVLCSTYEVGENPTTELKLPEDAFGLAWNSFAFCKFEEVNIPDGIGYIGRGAFMFCKNLKRVTIPSSVEVIDSGAFINCPKLEEVVFQGVFTGNAPVEIGSMAFCGCEKLKKIVLPSESVYDEAFEEDVQIIEK